MCHETHAAQEGKLHFSTVSPSCTRDSLEEKVISCHSDFESDLPMKYQIKIALHIFQARANIV